MPKFTVVVIQSASNQSFEKCLNALKNQTFVDFQALIMCRSDCYSTAGLIAQLNDKRFEQITAVGMNDTEACLCGQRLALGEFVSIMYQDDDIDPNALLFASQEMLPTLAMH
jgi:hypothetical protein